MRHLALSIATLFGRDTPPLNLTCLAALIHTRTQASPVFSSFENYWSCVWGSGRTAKSFPPAMRTAQPNVSSI
jgi:hypothetical protein